MVASNLTIYLNCMMMHGLANFKCKNEIINYSLKNFVILIMWKSYVVVLIVGEFVC
jgi:hypothetical protein